MQKARDTNLALLDKQVWELPHQPNKLWVQLLSSKYLQGQSILHCTISANASYIWRSILKAYGLLKEGFIWRIGHGESSFWYDKWMPSGPLCDLLPFVDIHDISMHVRDVFHEGNWCFYRLCTQVPLDVQLIVRGLLLSDDMDDVLIWAASTSGICFKEWVPLVAATRLC